MAVPLVKAAAVVARYRSMTTSTKSDSVVLTIIVPTLNEEKRIGVTLASLQALRNGAIEIIVADGGSHDCTRDIAQPLADLVIQTEGGRARQMNAGATHARGDLLLFLHADTVISPKNINVLLRHWNKSAEFWGRFDVRPDMTAPKYRMITTLMNWRSRLSGIATGDQAIFINRAMFESVGKFPDIPLMEDIEISRLLKKITAPCCIDEPVTISMRYWESHGTLLSILRMWRLRMMWFLGSRADSLHRHYYRD